MSKPAKQKAQHDEHAKSRSLVPGAAVLARDYSGPDKWISGIVLQRLGPITYNVEISNGRIVKRHIDQLKPRVEAKLLQMYRWKILPSWIINTTPLRMRFRSHRTQTSLKCDATPNVSIGLLIDYDMIATH